MTKQVDVNYFKGLLTNLEEDCRNIADEMEQLDPACKDFEDLDIEYNFLSGQTVMLRHVIDKLG